VVQELRATFKSGKTLPREWRLGQLRALQRLCTEGKDDLLDGMLKDLHKSTFEGVRLHTLRSQSCCVLCWLTRQPRPRGRLIPRPCPPSPPQFVTELNVVNCELQVPALILFRVTTAPRNPYLLLISRCAEHDRPPGGLDGPGVRHQQPFKPAGPLSYLQGSAGSGVHHRCLELPRAGICSCTVPGVPSTWCCSRVVIFR
jgi:hypothetical protein